MMRVMKNHSTGHEITVKEGFSWTVFFWGCFTPLARGDVKWAFIMFVSAIITCGFSWLVFPFIYNGIYINDLIKKGYNYK